MISRLKNLERPLTSISNKKAKVITDKWKGYRPIAKEYNIEQINSNGGIKLQGLTYDDRSNKYMDKDNLLMGE